MLIAKLTAIVMVVWFFLTAQKLNQPVIKWSIIGLIGYWLSWLLIDFAVDAVLPKTAVIFITMLPVFGAVVACYFVRIKLIHDANKPVDSATE
jgi:drug/metabolite transporter (DMT)-like permease